MRRAIAPLLVVALMAVVAIPAAGAATPPPTVENTRLARGPEKAPGGLGGPPPVFAGAFTPFGNGFVAVEVSEADQGMTDLDGDGSALGEVIHVSTSGGAVTNTGLTLFGDFAPFGGGLAFAAGIGGIYLLSGTTGTPTMIHHEGFDPVAVGSRLAFRVAEGGATDLNGDGDMTDNVAHFYNPATGTVTNSMLDAGFHGPPAVAVNGIAVIETTDGFSVFTYDPATSVATDTGLDGGNVTAFGSHFAVLVSEIAAGTDLNGDGDATDPGVVHVYDTVAKTSRNLGLDAALFPGGFGGRLVFAVIEANQGGTDLNGDGDLLDQVAHVYDPATSSTTNTRTASADFAAAGTRLAMTVFEAGQGATDLNGDGDLNDFVVGVFDPAAGTVISTGLDQRDFTLVADSHFGITVREAAQGNTNLNGDADLADDVLHIYDPATGSTRNTGLAVSNTFVAGDQLVAFVSEGAQGGTDLNGDGDTADAVAHIVNPATGAVANTRMAGALLSVFGSAGSLTAGGHWAAFAVSESDQGGTDLNGDGDTGDDVVHLTNTQRHRAVGLVDPSQGRWHLRSNAGTVTKFFYGNPGDIPFMGDWDCDGIETPGLYRQSDGFVYLRNSNTTGIADVEFFFGNPGDVPIAGDFDGDGCDTVSIYRPAEQRFYIINKLGSKATGLGAADFAYIFGDPGDKPFVGDFDGDGVETVGLHRESTGLVYFRNNHTAGIADVQYIFGDPGDRFIAGDWGPEDGVMGPALFRPSDTTFYFRWTNTQGIADDQLPFGQTDWLPVAGN